MAIFPRPITPPGPPVVEIFGCPELVDGTSVPDPADGDPRPQHRPPHGQFLSHQLSTRSVGTYRTLPAAGSALKDAFRALNDRKGAFRAFPRGGQHTGRGSRRKGT